MHNNREIVSFKYNNYSGQVNYIRNEIGKWFAAEEIAINEYFSNGYNKYSVLIQGFQNEFDSQEKAIAQVESYLKEIINNGIIKQFEAKNIK